jgi:hypothetical protein
MQKIRRARRKPVQEPRHTLIDEAALAGLKTVSKGTIFDEVICRADDQT